MNILKLIREMVEDELAEAGVVGDSQTLSMMQGVLGQILAKHGGNYQVASKSPEWQTAISNGEQARAASAGAPSLVKPMQTTGPVQKRTLADLRPSSATMAQKQQQQQQVQQQRSASVADKLRQQKKTQTMESATVGVSGLTETIRALVKEALEGTE